MTQTHLSRDAFERLSAELEELTTHGRVDVARRIEEARALGDLSENGDYHAAKDDQGKMEARIRQVQRMLETAMVVDEVGHSDEVVTGSVVALRYEGDDEPEQYLLGSIEERREGLQVISPGSPLGRALIGHRAGTTVEYQSPGGPLKVEIVAVGS